MLVENKTFPSDQRTTLFVGAKLYIDSKAQLTLLGTVMDYVEEKLRSEFVFENPNVTGFCGCGESFSLGDSTSLGGNKSPPKT